MGRYWLRLPSLLALVALVAVLTPLADAYPPDQTWQGGIYDGDDDYNNLSLTSTLTAVVVEADCVRDHLPTAVAIGVILPYDDDPRPSLARSSSEPRAPPAS